MYIFLFKCYCYLILVPLLHCKGDNRYVLNGFPLKILQESTIYTHKTHIKILYTSTKEYNKDNGKIKEKI